MNRLIVVVALMASCLALAGGKKYQVTGPVLEIQDDIIVVEKGKDRWEIKKGTAKAEGGELKVGSKVTIEYTMTAETITVKGAKDKGEKK